jgi:hypothetical protein
MSRVVEVAHGFSHRTADFGCLPSGSRAPTLAPVVDALQSFAFTLLGRTLAEVGLRLPIVGGSLTDDHVSTLTPRGELPPRRISQDR